MHNQCSVSKLLAKTSMALVSMLCGTSQDRGKSTRCRNGKACTTSVMARVFILRASGMRVAEGIPPSKGPSLKRHSIFQPSIFMGHVNLWRDNSCSSKMIVDHSNKDTLLDGTDISYHAQIDSGATISHYHLMSIARLQRRPQVSSSIQNRHSYWICLIDLNCTTIKSPRKNISHIQTSILKYINPTQPPAI